MMNAGLFLMIQVMKSPRKPSLWEDLRLKPPGKGAIDRAASFHADECYEW